MNKNELFSLLNKVFLGEEKEKFFDTKTTDGKILRIEGDVLQKGADVYVILEDGTIGAVDDGNYILETGETVIVTGGRVADFIPVTVDAPAEEEVPAEEAAPEADAPVADAPAADAPTDAPAGDVTPSAEVVDEIVSAENPENVSEEMDWTEAVKALAEEIASLKEMVANLTASNQAMESHIAQFSKLPSEEQIKKEKTGFKNETEKNKGLTALNLEKIRALRSK